MRPRAPVLRRRLTVRGTVQGVGISPLHPRSRGGDGPGGVRAQHARGRRHRGRGARGRPGRAGAARIRSAAPAPGRRRSHRGAGPRAARALGLHDRAQRRRRRGSAGAAGRRDVRSRACRRCGTRGRRRAGHAFISCTDCGPRFTIALGLPFDRENTTMAPFAMCPACRSEYEDPLDRRFHAQTIACPDCGPRLWLEEPAGAPRAGDAARSAAARAALGAGRDPRRQGGRRMASGLRCGLRGRRRAPARAQGQGEKPFAVMARDLDVAAPARAAHGRARGSCCARPAAPIVLVPAIAGSRLARRSRPAARYAACCSRTRRSITFCSPARRWRRS